MADKKKIARIIFIVILSALIVATVWFIWSHSFSNGEKSTEQSTTAYDTSVEIVEDVAGKPAAEKYQEKVTPKVFRKLAHVGEFAALGLETNLLLLCIFGFKYWNFLWATVFGIIIASLDEIIQLSSAGREGKVTDVLIDLTGFTFCSLVVFVAGIIVKLKRKKKLNKELNKENIVEQTEQ